jgi:C4-dicarboxylate transporter, DctM subunit
MNTDVALLLFGSFVVLLAVGAPIYLSLGLSSLLCIAVFGLVPLEVLPNLLQGSFSSFTLLAIPFFILAGNLLASSEMTVRLIDLAKAIVGKVRGGLAVVSVMTGVFFAGISGSGPADTAALSATLSRPLRRDGYDPAFSAALLAATGAIGVIMPPSIALIIYGVVANVSVGRLFIAGVFPALVVAFCLSLLAVLMARKNGWGSGEEMKIGRGPDGYGAGETYTAEADPDGSRRETSTGSAVEPAGTEQAPGDGDASAPNTDSVLVRDTVNGAGPGRLATLVRTFRRAVWGLLAPLIILGGIYGGIFTPTEAAAVVVIYALFVGFVVYRDMRPSALPPVLAESTRTTGVVMIIIASASLFAFVLNTQGIATAAGEWLSSLAGGTLTTLIVINVILLLAGTFLDAISIFYIFVPILLPVAMAAGMDPVHFGVVATVNLAIGMTTPPVGVNLYVAAAMGRVPVSSVVRAVGPILAAQLVALVIVNAFPQLSLWLPDALGVM